MMKQSLIAYLASTGAALAHPGHIEAVTEGEWHWLTEADHLAVVIPAVVAAVLGGRIGLRALRRIREEGRRRDV